MRINKYYFAVAIALIMVLMVLSGQALGERADDMLSERVVTEPSEEFSVLTWTGPMDLVEAMSKPSFLVAVKSANFYGASGQAAIFSQNIQGFPKHGDKYTLISTGFASQAPGQAQTFANTDMEGGRFRSGHSPHGYDANDLAELIVTVDVPNDANSLIFNYKFGTEENPGFLGSPFQDYFRVLARITSVYHNTYIPLLPDGSRFVSVDNANKYSNSPGGTSEEPSQPFPNPNDTVYNAVTELQQVSFDVSKYQGKEMTLIIEIADATDGSYDSAVWLDAFEFSTTSKGFLTLPFSNPGVWVGWIFDPLINNDFPDQPPHYGIDFILGDAPSSSWKQFAVVAAAGGKAYRWSHYDSNGRGFGEYVVIEHDVKDSGGNKYYTLYSHLRKDSINSKIPLRGQGSYNINQGEYLGMAGDTGSPGLRHLHFEVRPGNVAGKQVDPYDLFDPSTRKYNHRDSKRHTPAVQLQGGPNHLWTSNPPKVATVPVQTLTVSVQSPVSLSMLDSAGRVTGVVGGQIKSEIPGASYCPDAKEIVVVGAYDNYDIQVIGEEDGIYSLNCSFYNENNNQWYKYQIKDQPISTGETHDYINIEWDLIAPSRLYGANRYETGVEISLNGWNRADTVIIARGDDYADALAGVPLAYHLNAPILLTPTTKLDSASEVEIERLGASRVILLGGDAAISGAVKSELESKGLTVERISGANRYATAAEIAKRLREEGVFFDTAFIAVGTNFADALAASSYAAKRGEPILLTGTDTLPDATSEAIADLGIANTFVCGGNAAVSDEVFGQLPDPVRIFGANRYATALALAEEFLPKGTTHVGIATGLNFPDAVAGGVWAAKVDSGILLVDGSAGIPGVEVQNFIAKWDMTAVTLFGGPGAVSSEMANWFDANLGD